MLPKVFQTLNDVCPDGFTGSGIFSALQAFNVPWRDENISSVLDAAYYGNFSGDKVTSPIVDRLSEDGTLSADAISLLAGAIYKICARSWDKEYATLSAIYDPIENYRMIEQMSDDETVTNYGRRQTRTDALQHSKTGTDSETPNITRGKTGTETETPAVTIETDDKLYGFNSSSGVSSNSRDQTSSGQTQTAYNTQETESGSLSKTYNTVDSDTGTQTTADSGSDTHTRNYSLTRSGNIGVTTSQQMLQSERDLWMWNFFYQVVFPDVDRVLTIQTY